MHRQTLYFGTLQINIDTPRPAPWRDFEKRFFTPVLPVTRQLNVRVRFVDVLPQPAGQLVQKTRSADIYFGETEERIYYPTYIRDQRPSTYSRCCGDGVEILHVDDRDLWTHPNFYLLTMIHLEKYLLENNAMVLHSCYTEYRGGAILFTAPSGTGKTTQAEIWKRVYGSSIVNGDKCLLQKTEEGFRAAGFFIHGSASECENRTMPIHAIAIVRQSDRDFVRPIPAARKVGLLYSEITVNGWDQQGVAAVLDLLTELIRDVPILELHCTMADSAAQVLHDYLFGGKDGTV